jgi:hypothetical protein
MTFRRVSFIAIYVRSIKLPMTLSSWAGSILKKFVDKILHNPYTTGAQGICLVKRHLFLIA